MRRKRESDRGLSQKPGRLRKSASNTGRVGRTLLESGETWRCLVRNAPDIIIIAGRDGTIHFVNHTVTGIAAEKAVGKKLYDYTPTEHHELIRTSLIRVFETGECHSFELAGVGPHGATCWYQSSVGPIKKNGHIIAASLICRDITERRTAEEQVRRLSTAVEQSTDGIAIGDLEPTLVYVNSAFARIHGYGPDEMIGMKVADLHNGEQKDAFRRSIDQIRSEGPWKGEIGHIRKDGSALLTYMSVTLLRNDVGEPTGILAIARDITESKRRLEELNLYREKIVKAEQLASLGTLSAAAAHELTQPLTTIRLSIENVLVDLQSVPCSDEVREQLNVALRGATHIREMADRLRGLSRTWLRKTVQEVDLNAVAENVLRLLKHSAWRAGCRLRTCGLDGLPQIRADEQALEQLFFVLIQNAIDATDGRKDYQVIVSGQMRDWHIELQFSDNGRGISPENLDRVFEPFFTTKPVGKGTGLGLCTAKRIVSQAGGRIRVESKPGAGTTFFVSLPLNGDGRS